MTIEEFAKWSAFFKEQLVRPGEETTWLDDWFRDFRDFPLADAMDAVRYVRQRFTRFDVAQRCAGRLLEFLRARRDDKQFDRRLSTYRDTKPADALLGDEWTKSERRRRFLQFMDRQAAKKVAAARLEQEQKAGPA